jgi:hypothetical protein
MVRAGRDVGGQPDHDLAVLSRPGSTLQAV